MGRRADIIEAERSFELIKREKQEKGKVIKQTLRFLFSQVGLVFLGIFVAVIGAQIFISLEHPYEATLYEDKREAAKRVEAAANYLTGAFYNYAHDKDRYNYTYDQFVDAVEIDLRTFASFVINVTDEFGYDGYIDGWDWAWTFPKALLFTITIMTTIGYGHIYPLTLMGKMFCILYSLIAVAVFFVILANIGSALADGLTFLYSRICCRCFRSERLRSEIPSRIMRKKLKRRLVDEEVGEEAFMPTNSIPIPIVVSVMILFMYIGIGAVVFNQWEDWDVVTAAYFSFITLTTIGLGDLVPERSFTGIDDPNADGMDYFKLVFSTIYCAIGLAVISLCISLIQEQVGRSAAIALGVKAEVIEMDVVEIVPRKSDFLNTDHEAAVDEEPEAVLVAPLVEPNLPGETPSATAEEDSLDEDEAKDDETEEETDDISEKESQKDGEESDEEEDDDEEEEEEEE